MPERDAWAVYELGEEPMDGARQVVAEVLALPPVLMRMLNMAAREGRR